ncbi:MAG: xanthine dehydrogenase family protein molybdopterin-binding subunit [Acidobacteria bacterium]|nr:xanthine dehydrogenase family protein molybdopterin-binding subunit [Acidobacteriota bacterium]
MSAPARTLTPQVIPFSRREFLRLTGTAGAGLLLGVYLPNEVSASPAADFSPNAWLKISPDNTVTVIIARSEMGQGIRTSLPMLVAEELEADWSQIKIEPALANKALYGDQGTGGSESVKSLFAPLRKAGATAREMLISAAAEKWNVPRGTLHAEKGFIVSADGKNRAKFGELVEAAAKLPIPKEVTLKDPKDFRILGTRTHRIDTPSKTDGIAEYGIDVKIPGMAYAAVARCPVFGGKVASFDGTKSKAVPSVRDVIQVDGGVAVIAENTWAAFEGRKALEVKWDEGPNASFSTTELQKQFVELAEKPGHVFRQDGDAEKAMEAAPKRVSAIYTVPFLSHAPMEPMNCTVHVKSDGVEVWAPTQVPNDVQDEIAKLAGVKIEDVKLHITLMGGGFGRRLMTDYGVEAARVSKAIGGPVKVVWSREDDMRGAYYRPPSYHQMRGAVGADGWPVAFSHKVVAPSILEQLYPGATKEGKDQVVADQTTHLYETPNVHLEYVMANTPVIPCWWRSVYCSQTAFASEAFMDELATLAGKDPYEFRMKLLEDERSRKSRRGEWHTGRLRNVLQLAATNAGWGKPLPKGRARGIACYPSFGSYAAQVAEVSLSPTGSVRVHKMTCAVDCGMHVNPDIIEAQMEGSVAFALSAVLHGAITIEKGRTRQSNFHDYQVLRMDEMPVVETHIVKNTEAPGGIGEPGIGPVAPAVANAVFVLTGKRLRTLPFKL